MFDKRLFSVAPGIGGLIAGKVALLWVSLLANIGFVVTLVALLSGLLGGAEPVITPTRAALYAGIFVVCALVRYLTIRAAAGLGTEAAERVKLGLRERLYRKMLAFGPSYGTRVTTADVVQSAGEGIEQVQTFFELFLPQLFYAILAPITLFAVIAPINMPTAVTLLVCAPLIVLIVGMVAMSAARMFKKYWGTYTDMGATFLDDMQGLETLKIFDADERAARAMDDKAERFRIMTMRVLQIQLRSLSAMDLVAYGGTAAGIGVALWQYATGRLQWMPGHSVPLGLAGVVLIVLLSADFFIPLRQLGSYFHVAMNGMTSTKRIFALLDAPEPQRGDVELDTAAGAPAVAFERVGYAYERRADASGRSDKSSKSGGSARPDSRSAAPSAPALSDITFLANPGQVTAIVGVSGSGKSTAAALLAGTLVGYTGSIALLDARGRHELRGLTAASLTRAVTVVGARSHLFAGTIRENLLLARPDAGDDDLWEALRRAHIDDFVREQSEGLDARIESGATNLSGGQRQRLAIARALLHDSAVYVFDEATSSVDVESESLILASIRALATAGKTVIMITHRMANAVDADIVVVFDHGEVVQSGKHRGFIGVDGAYARLFRAQSAIERVGRRSSADDGAQGSAASSAVVPVDGSADSDGPAAPAKPADPAAPDDSAAPSDDPGVSAPHEGAVAAGASTSAVIARLLREARPLAGLMTAASVAGTIGHLAATFLPVFGVMAAFALAGSPVWGMGAAPAVTVMVVCAILRGLMRYVEQYLNHNVAFRLLALFRSKSFAALRRLAPAKLAGKGKGDLIALITTDVELLEIFFAHTISPVVIAVTTSVVYACLLLALSPALAGLLVVAHLVIGVVVPRFFATGVQNLGPTIRRQASELDDVMLDDMRGLGEIIGFGRGEDRVRVIVERTKSLWAEHARLSRVNGGFAGIGTVLVMTLTIASEALAVALAVVSPSDIPALVTGVVLIASSFGPTLALSALPANLTQTFASARRLFALMDEHPAVVETGTAAPPYRGMALDHVTFAYGDDDPVLGDLTLDVPRSGILGVQGPSGRGKSTVLKLLMRYWDPQRGAVLFSGEPLPGVDAHHRRRVQTMMSQETALFDGTIRENLMIALPAESAAATGSDADALLREACRKASVLDLIGTLPDGLDTQVGELGDRLSEGERQRIGLARVFLRNADLVLFDEPTSRLDALNEAVILQSINALADERDAAIVLVSHRASTMRIADRVLRM